MKTIIYTSFDCLIKAENFQETLDTNSHLTIDNQNQKYFVYPLQSHTHPSFEIDFDSPNSQFYRIIRKYDVQMVFLLDGIVTKSVKIFHIHSNNPCDVEISKNEVVLCCQDEKKIFHIPNTIQSSKCGHFHHIVYAILFCKDREYCLLFNTKNFNSKVLQGAKIKLENDKIFVQKSCFGYDEIIEEYIITSEGLKIEEKTFKSQNNIPQKMLAYKFLKSVECCDYKNALSMLGGKLSHLSEKSLKEYFGNISCIFPISSIKIFTLSNNKSTLYTFEIENGKINDIIDEMF